MALSGLLHPRRRAQEAQLAHALRSVPLFREMPAAALVAIWPLLSGRVSLVRAFNRALCDRVALMNRLLEDRATGAGGGPAGLRFGPYCVVEQLGVGGMAAVYSAVHVGTDAAVALKVLPAAWGA